MFARLGEISLISLSFTEIRGSFQRFIESCNTSSGDSAEILRVSGDMISDPEKSHDDFMFADIELSLSAIAVRARLAGEHADAVAVPQRGAEDGDVEGQPRGGDDFRAAVRAVDLPIGSPASCSFFFSRASDEGSY